MLFDECIYLLLNDDRLSQRPATKKFWFKIFIDCMSRENINQADSSLGINLMFSVFCVINLNATTITCTATFAQVNKSNSSMAPFSAVVYVLTLELHRLSGK